ncbi:TonB-dependent receptor [Chitinophaga nivalis]|uniref:TonB-dependent receptor plug domain-containing protein n=1 Tax=Chitinophaga nivalis TaxID=2991709 RepID=A0ABT3IUL6_9BACT|nr:TonB-dependent receptor plug domain-containing protein [Chitinophaga nivalis]MCW3462905.1 TonB-dependent receptor plug domain-containing protein [Chitinophaga nivalis]MCW3487405.1 TonB-dependent receptor plug domain-containing protein [Chitinophaga nivalis]
MKYRLYVFLLLLFPVLGSAQQREQWLQGKVVDLRGRPIAFATVALPDLEQVTYTNAAGGFHLRVDSIYAKTVSLRITYVGKKSIDTTVAVSQPAPLFFMMQELSLSLSMLQVTATRKNNTNSNSSIVYDREAIEQIQAYSLADVLRTLPGKTMAPPDLQYKQQITLRSESTDQFARNNSLGVAIIVDGVRRSNDGNMQSRSASQWGMGGSLLTNHKDPFAGNPSYDVAFSGIDLRDIPADNIESIEVISGVAAAKYGEITDGAIIVNRQAGKTDYRYSMRFNGSSVNTSLSKGYSLGPKLGALNVNVNYLYSNQDPRDKMKIFSRVTAGLMWTTYLAKGIKNTFSLDYGTKIDNAKQDPDDNAQERTYSKDRRIAFSNRMAVEVNQPWLKNISFTMSYDRSYQESYRQLYLNGAPKAMADKDTTGIYEGYYIPGNYLALDHIIGRPSSFSGSLQLSNEWMTGRIRHGVSAGVNVNVTGNNGKGIVIDPTRPRFVNQGYKNERPYDFNLLPSLINYGFYAEDNMLIPLLGKELRVQAGMRYDLQNGFASLQPRINASYQLDKHWRVNMAYGIASKSPTMAHRYPAPVYYDIPLVNAYAGDVRESMYLVYTRKEIPDNRNMKPAKSAQVEAGVSYSKHGFSSSVFVYFKNNTDGFGEQSLFSPETLPVYDYQRIPGQKPVYFPTNKSRTYLNLSRIQLTNNLSDRTFGAEWFISTPKIKAILTSFNLSTSYSSGTYRKEGTLMVAASESSIDQGKKAWFGIYDNDSNKSWSLTTKLSADTHIPQLGFLITLSADIYWQNAKDFTNGSNYPHAYVDATGTIFPIAHFDPANPDYGHLTRRTGSDNRQRLPFVYSNMSLRVAKEIRQKIRFSVYAYNFLNLQPKHYFEDSRILRVYNSPVNVGAEMSIKF